MSCTRERGPHCHLKKSKGHPAAAPESYLCQVINLIQSREDLLVQIHHLSIRPRQSNWIGHVEQGKYFLERKQMIGLHLCSVRSVCFFWTGSGDKFLSIMLDMQWIPTWNGIFSPSRITLAGRLTPLSGLYCQLDKCHFETATTASPGQVLTQAGAHIVNMHRCMRYIQIRSIILHWATNHPWSRLGLTWLKKLHDVRQKIECPNRILKSQNRRLPCRYICNCTCRITINHSEDQQDPRNYSQLFPQNSLFFSKPLKFSLDRRNKGIFKTVPFLKTVKAPFQPIHCPHL